MKNTILIALTLLVIACGCSNTSQEPKRILKENFEKYISSQFLEDGDKMTLDSIVVMDVDTLTEKQSIEIKQNQLALELEKQMEVVKNDMFQIDNGKALKFDDYMINEYQDQLNKDRDKLGLLIAKSKQLREASEHADDKKFKCYIVSMEIYTMENGAARKTEIALPANDKFKPIDIRYF